MRLSSFCFSSLWMKSRRSRYATSPPGIDFGFATLAWRVGWLKLGEKFKRFNTEFTEERRRAQRKTNTTAEAQRAQREAKDLTQSSQRKSGEHRENDRERQSSHSERCKFDETWGAPKWGYFAATATELWARESAGELALGFSLLGG